jgi:hypothetical protein
MLLLVQVLIPLALLAALAVPARRRLTKMLQAAAVFVYLLAVHLAGLWLDLPWWTPWALWVLFGVSLLAGRRRRPESSGRDRRGWFGLAFAGAAAIGFGAIAAHAALSRMPPAGPVIDLASPLAPGRYLVVNGGRSSLINGHLKTLHPKTARQAAYRGQSYGVDIVGLTAFGRTSDGWRPRAPDRYAIFGRRVVAPCDGRVVASLDGRPDMPVPVLDQQVMAGNHVVLGCGDVHVLLAHLRRGSVAVREGQRVRTGQTLGEVGNSGNSDQPHLHIHVQRPGQNEAPFAADPLPFRIGGRYLVRGDRL